MASNLMVDLLEDRAFPEVAAALRARSEQILARWEQSVRQLLPGADELTLAQVRDHVPEILGQMATALAASTSAPVEELREFSRSHGEVRFHQQYNVRELIIEYRLLRRIVVEEIHDASGGELSLPEMIVLDMGVDTAFQQGLLAFINHQREQIEAANEIESKYLRFLSHDLRNNLNQVMLVLELLKSRLDPLPDFREDVTDLVSAHRTVMQTISGMDTLLQAERLRKGAIEPRAEPIRLIEVVGDVVRHVHSQAVQKGLALECECPEDAVINSDRELIALILQNLLGNAIKYSSRGTIRMTVDRWSEAARQGWCISVADQGPGIAPEHMRRLFNAFTRGQTHGQPGVGLGLAIASQATKLLGGTLSVQSTLGSGSTFRLALPAGEPETAELPIPPL